MGKRVQFSGYELDFGRFQLSRDGKPVVLEGLPLQLLMYLVENPGQLLTRDQIADKLWGKDVFVDIEQGINTAIRKIRRALEDDTAQPNYLQTVVGRGYRFVAETHIEGVATGATAEPFSISPEEFGRAVMAAAGLEPETSDKSAKDREPAPPSRRAV
jgi:DNA-binding winged helix-turn-helix (wHTH) protein